MSDALELADFLVSDQAAADPDLSETLRARFGHVSPDDAFTAISLAVCAWDAALETARASFRIAALDRNAAQIEARHLRAQVAVMRDGGSWLRARPAPQRRAANG